MVSLFHRGIIRNDSFWDRLVLKKVRDSLGGRVRLMVVGSAPMAANVLSFMRAALGCTVSWMRHREGRGGM